MKLFRLLCVVALLVVLSPLTTSGGAAAVDVYTEEGFHHVNGRDWHTKCEPYSQTERCTTKILATQVQQVGNRFVQTTDWVFNNLTYKASPRTLWTGNPLGGNGKSGAAFGWRTDEHHWRVECDTPATGNGACRAFIRSRIIESYLSSTGNREFRWTTKWVFNNIVLFSAAAPPTPSTTQPAPTPTRSVTPTPFPTPTPTATSPTPTATPTATPTVGVAPPVIVGISSRANSSVSLRFTRSEADGVCTPELGYQVKVDDGSWSDVGNFNSACNQSTIGYKFDGLTPGTEYELAIRAVRTDGEGKSFSQTASIISSTTGTRPTVSATPSPSPSATPSATPTTSPSPSDSPGPVDRLAPRNLGLTNQGDTSISIGFLRPLDSLGKCQSRITFQVRVDGGDWSDVGGFDAACERDRVGYKFDGLLPGTQYELGLRAIHTADGAKSFSAVVTAMGSTTGETPTATPTPTGTPTIDPTPTSTASPTPTSTPPTPTATPTPTVEPTATLDPKKLSAPRLRGPVNQSETSVSIVIYRVAESFGVCQTDIFYEMRGGAYTDWYTHGTFPTAPCDDPDPGFKFQNLEPDTAYTFEVRAYRLVGDEKYYSPVSTISGRTLPTES